MAYQGMRRDGEPVSTLMAIRGQIMVGHDRVVLIAQRQSTVRPRLVYLLSGVAPETADRLQPNRPPTVTWVGASRTARPTMTGHETLASHFPICALGRAPKTRATEAPVGAAVTDAAFTGLLWEPLGRVSSWTAAAAASGTVSARMVAWIVTCFRV